MNKEFRDTLAEFKKALTEIIKPFLVSLVNILNKALERIGFK